ncbi:MAG: acetoacetyl-CoA reductase [Gammaproteobacteria bacterium]|nr:acetoacetyl-CoA reductase [Gammaproteobacteria bacterium]
MFDSSNSIVNDYVRQSSDLANGQVPKQQSSQVSRKTAQLDTAVITGGIGGIGTAICKRLAANGNRIISTYIPSEKTKAAAWKKDLEKEGYEVEVYVCDVSDYQSCKTFASFIEEKYGKINILVNGAGITRDAMLKKMDKAKWDAVINTNLDSVFNMTRSFINGMIDNKYGRIINISSVNGQKGQFGQTNYSTAKAGMIGFTRSLALELADKGITVNCICPGYVGTPMVEAIREDILDGIIQQIPMKRLAKVEEIADAIAFLADKNSGYITGTELAVNGGLWMG